MESPLDVLSMAASIIQQKEARNKLGENLDKDGSNDSGFEDNSSPPLKTSSSGEKKEPCSLAQTRSSFASKNAPSTPSDERARSPEFIAESGQAPPAKLLRDSLEEDRPIESELKGHVSLARKASDAPCSPDKKRPRCDSPFQNETRESVIKTPISASSHPKYAGSPHKTSVHYGYPFLSSYGMPLAMMPRPSVITAAGSPSDFKAPAFPCYHCIQSNCRGDVKPTYADLHHPHAREMHSAVPTGFESPTVDDHFKKSLGAVYDRLSPRGQQYDLKASTTCLSSRGSSKEPPAILIPKTIARPREVGDRIKSEYYHSAPAAPDHVYRDYAMAPTHSERHHYRYDPIGRYSPEHFHRPLTTFRNYEHPSLKSDHRFFPRSLEEPCSVEEHFAKALGQVWFDVQGHRTDHVMRYHNKGLRVAHQ